jgi:hypothetical protein
MSAAFTPYVLVRMVLERRKVRFHVRLLPYRGDKPIGVALEQHECGITQQAPATVGTGVARG